MMNRRTLPIVLVLFLLVGIGVTEFALTRVTDDRSKAKEFSNLSTVLPKPKTQLHGPFIRLVTSASTVAVGEQIPIDVYVNTDGKEIVDATVAVSYDPTIFEVDENSITHKDTVFPVVSIDQVSPGAFIFSLFLKEETGYTPVVTHGEEKVATVFFRVIGNSKKTSDITFIHQGDPAVGLFQNINRDTHETKNILESFEGVSVTIQ